MTVRVGGLGYVLVWKLHDLEILSMKLPVRPVCVTNSLKS